MTSYPFTQNYSLSPIHETGSSISSIKPTPCSNNTKEENYNNNNNNNKITLTTCKQIPYEEQGDSPKSTFPYSDTIQGGGQYIITLDSESVTCPPVVVVVGGKSTSSSSSSPSSSSNIPSFQQTSGQIQDSTSTTKKGFTTPNLPTLLGSLGGTPNRSIIRESTCSYSSAASTNGGSFSSVMSGYGGIEQQGTGVDTPVSRPRTSDNSTESFIKTSSSSSSAAAAAAAATSTPTTFTGNHIPHSNPGYQLPSRVSYPGAGPSTFQQPGPVLGGRMIGSTGFNGMSFGNFNIQNNGGYYPVQGGNNGMMTMTSINNTNTNNTNTNTNTTSSPPSASTTFDPLTGLPTDQFDYDAASAALPPISQNFVRPNIDDSRRPATSAGIMLRTFAGGYEGFGFSGNSGVGLGLGVGEGSSTYSGSNSKTTMRPGVLTQQQLQESTDPWQSLPTSSHGGFVDPNHVSASGNDDNDDLKDVFSHTVDVNGMSILGGPTFQDPFAIETTVQGNIGGGNVDFGQLPPDRQMMHAGNINFGMNQMDMTESHPHVAHQYSIPMNQSTSTFDTSSMAWSNANANANANAAAARRASEPHSKFNQHNVRLPSHATLYQTLGLGPSVPPGHAPGRMPPGQQQALAIAAFAAHRGDKDLGDLNTNQLRHLIAQRRGSVEYSRQPQTASSIMSSSGFRRSSDGPNGGISPAQIALRSSSGGHSQQRRPVSQGNMSYIDPRMTMTPLVDDGWQDRYAPASSSKTIDPSAAYGRPPPGELSRIPGDGVQKPVTLNGYEAATARYHPGHPYEPRHPDDVRDQPSTFGTYPPGHVPLTIPYTNPNLSRPSTADRRGSIGTSAAQQGSNTAAYSFQSHIGPAPKKRPRRKFDQIERLYLCGFEGCEKSYGTLNHLNAHVSMQKHGVKRRPEEFKEIRKEWRKRKKEETIRARMGAVTNSNQDGFGGDPGNTSQAGGGDAGAHSSHDDDSFDEEEHWRDDSDDKRAYNMHEGYVAPHAGSRVGVGYEQAAGWNGMHNGAINAIGHGAEYEAYMRR